MKNTIKLLATALLLFFAQLSFSQFSLVGKWQGIDMNDTGFMHFFKDGHMTMTIDGEEVGGVGSTFEGIPISIKYEVEKGDKERYKINIYLLSVQGNDSTIMLVWPGLFKVKNNKSFTLSMNLEHQDFGQLPKAKIDALRPKGFTVEDDIIILTRIK